MKLRLITLLLVSSLLSCVNKIAKPEPSNNKIAEVERNLIPPVYIEGDSTWTIESRMNHYGVPGVSIAVINNGKIEWTKTYGIMDKTSKAPVTRNTLFQAASISKPVSAYAALRLVEQNKINLNADVNSQLKSWQLAENEFTVNKKVTLKNLLNHSAGTTVHGFFGYSPDLPVPTLVQVLSGTPPANSRTIVVDKVPEKSFRYSGGGYNIVQQLMIDSEGKSFPQILDEQVLTPLGMDKSTFNQPLENGQLNYAATGYLPDGSMTKGKRHTYPEMAAAGLWTTAEDLARFAVNIQKTMKGESSRGLSKKMTTKMLTPFVEDFVGLGIFLNKKNEQIYFGHGGWNEGFSSELVANKEKDYGVAVMINSNHPDFISELIRSVALTYDWTDYLAKYKTSNLKDDIDPKLLGKYNVRGFDIIEILKVNNKLMYKYGAAGEVLPFLKVSDSTYVRRDRDVVYQFEKYADGDSLKLRMLNTNTYESISEYDKLSKETLLPIEVLVAGNYEDALKAFKSVQAKDKTSPAVDENNLNMLGYQYLQNDKKNLAKELFAINMALYPEGYNTYDSYAEACLELGEYKRAIEFYKKSLDLNPENDNARRQIEKIKMKK